MTAKIIPAPQAAVRFRIKGTGVYVQPVAYGGYQAGSTSPRLSRWIPPSSGPNQMLDGSFEMLRSRSRDAVRQLGYAETGVEVLVTNIVGTGIKPQFSTPDSAFNRVLAEAFLAWTDEADADGRLDFYGLQALAVRSMVEGGDCFSRLRTRLPQDGLSVPFQIQVVESEFCPVDKNNAPRTTGNAVRCGVEFDSIGRRAGYHLFKSHPNDQNFLTTFGLGETAFVPATEIAHLAMLTRPGMVRGEPWLTRALVKLHDLDKYDDAQLVRQQIAALFTGFVHDDDPDETDPVFAGQGEADEGGVALAGLEPGTVQMLPSGKTIEWSEPPDPGNNYIDFGRAQLRAVANSLGILYEQLSGDYEKINDRTFRAAVNEFRRRCAVWQHHGVVFQWCRPVIRRWVELAVLSGRITPPAGITVGMIARPKWVPQAWAYINPVQDVQARQLEVRAGFNSRRNVVSEGGEDVEQIDDEIATDNERADAKGLIFDSDPRKTSTAGVAAGQDDDPAPRATN
jgi:lambda family phage portal protein